MSGATGSGFSRTLRAGAAYYVRRLGVLFGRRCDALAAWIEGVGA